MPRSRLLLVALAVAVVVVAGAIVLSSSGGDQTVATRTTSSTSTQERGLLEGIPQDGAELGSPSAPYVLEEFADLQCPYCAEVAREALPAVIERYVRPGKVRLRFVNLAFLGEDSVTLGHLAQAAGQQDHLWDVVEGVYANQGQENSGYATEAFQKQVLAAIPGLDAARALRDRDANAADRALERDQRTADRAGIDSTPTFFAGPAGKRLTKDDELTVPDLTAQQLTAELDRVLAQR